MNLERIFFIYFDKTDDGRIYYVGKGLKDRIQQKKRNKKHKAISKKFGLNREIVFETNDEKEAFAKEVELIALHKTFTTDWSHQTIACNFTLGGDGASGFYYKKTKEHRAKLSAALKGRKISEEHRLKIIAASTGRKHPPRSEESRAKISASLIGKPGRNQIGCSEETKKKISQNAYGRKISDAQRIEIKELYATGKLTQKEISEMFAVDASRISRIINNKG